MLRERECVCVLCATDAPPCVRPFAWGSYLESPTILTISMSELSLLSDKLDMDGEFQIIITAPFMAEPVVMKESGFTGGGKEKTTNKAKSIERNSETLFVLLCCQVVGVGGLLTPFVHSLSLSFLPNIICLSL